MFPSLIEHLFDSTHPLRHSVSSTGICQSVLVSDGLMALRLIYFAVVQTTVLLGVVVAVMSFAGAYGHGPVSLWVGAGGVVAMGVLTAIASAVAPPALDCRTPARLAATYRTRLIIRLALAEAPMLAGFVAALVTANPFVYLVGTPFAVPAFSRAAPSHANLEREQDDLILQGCGISLSEALRGG